MGVADDGVDNQVHRFINEIIIRETAVCCMSILEGDDDDDNGDGP